MDKHGKEIVDFILKKEYERCSASQSHVKTMYRNMKENNLMVAEDTVPYMSDTNFLVVHRKLNAAHERTDIEVTDDMKKHDDDIMDDDDF